MLRCCQRVLTRVRICPLWLCGYKISKIIHSSINYTISTATVWKHQLGRCKGDKIIRNGFKSDQVFILVCALCGQEPRSTRQFITSSLHRGLFPSFPGICTDRASYYVNNPEKTSRLVWRWMNAFTYRFERRVTLAKFTLQGQFH